MHEGCFGVIASYFRKAFIFQMNFNDFIWLSVQLDATWGAFWVELEALWRYFGAILG